MGFSLKTDFFFTRLEKAISCVFILYLICGISIFLRPGVHLLACFSSYLFKQVFTIHFIMVCTINFSSTKIIGNEILDHTGFPLMPFSFVVHFLNVEYWESSFTQGRQVMSNKLSSYYE